ncbi:HNH endonuclease family protein [Amycolatopsis sp. NPDC051903]|uniref:HNH endonuclease family protein n=1 Tax=Amycolatopsis sp. NPDC051903 TaxID=3363936 RepID=UPI00379C44B5
MTTHTTVRALLTAAPIALATATTPAACHVPDHTTVTPAAGTAPTATAVDVAGARRQLAGLRVAPADTGAHYSRADWPHWSIVAGDCDARETVLRNQGRGVTTGAHCTVTAGTWTSPYDGTTVTRPGALDIDHMVPLAEAARSGTRGWTRAQRERYPNDTRLVLVAVTAKSNRSKGDQDPAHWLPARDRCGYVAHWVAVKATYGMTVDTAEHDAIASVLTHC